MYSVDEMKGWVRSYVHRMERSTNALVESPTAFHFFARWFIPWLGVSKIQKALLNVAAVMESISNSTTDAIQVLQEEIPEIGRIGTQNRIAFET